ncbi:hypothetical protein BsWGS_15457 [Bradybaena similaris]
MEPPAVTGGDVYDNNCSLLSTHISSRDHDNVRGNLLIKVSGCQEGATLEQVDTREKHPADNTMIEFTKCSSPAGYRNQDSPLDFSIKRRTSFSGSLTDDSQTSSSSPGHTTDYSMRSPSADTIPVEDISGISRWKTPSSDGSDDQAHFEKTKSIASPVPLPGLLCNLGLVKGNLINHLTSDSEMNAFSQLAGVVFNDKCDQKSSSFLQRYQNEALHMPLGFLGIGGPATAAVQNGIDMSLLMGVNAKKILHIYQQQLQRVKTAEWSARFSTQSSVSSSSRGNQQDDQHRNHNFIRIPPVATNNSMSPHLNLTPSPSITLQAGNLPGLMSTSFTSKISPLAHSNSRKRASSLPDDQKDDAYWERRRKNNDAAKRSRDARRAKEEEIAVRATLLEQENLKLREELALLRTETHRLRHMLYTS